MKRFLIIAASWLAFVAPSFAADSTVSALTAATSPLDGTELYYCVPGGVDRKCTGAQIQAETIPHPGYVANNWYLSPSWGQLGSLNNSQSNTIVCKYGAVPRLVTVGALAVRIQQVGTTNIQLAIYNNGTNGRPGALISNTGNIVNTSTGAVSGNLGANKQIGPGGAGGGRDIWWCANSGDGTVQLLGSQTAETDSPSYIGSSSAANLFLGTTTFAGLYCQGASCNGGSSTFGTWPATLAGSTWTEASGANIGNVMPTIAFSVVTSP